MNSQRSVQTDESVVPIQIPILKQLSQTVKPPSTMSYVMTASNTQRVPLKLYYATPSCEGSKVRRQQLTGDLLVHHRERSPFS